MPRGNPQNFIPINQRSEEEQKEMRHKAGVNSGKSRRDKRRLRDCLEVLLEKKILSEDGKKITGAEALSIEIFQKALEGDMKAWELLRDTVGQKPVDKIEQTSTNIVIDLGESDDSD